jgi:hypothetical protein
MVGERRGQQNEQNYDNDTLLAFRESEDVLREFGHVA